VGFGASVAIAEQNARLALAMGGRDGALHVGFPDGEVLRADPGRPATTYRLRETRHATERVARELGIGPLALTRLTRALRQIDPSAVTASDLAKAYGIEARSARRLMTALTRAGFATRSGRQGGPRAGRPQIVYRIDMDRLAGAASGT
jgi:predicted ArsR family transcriptional regulator